MAHKTNLDDQNLKAALDKFAAVGPRPRKHRLGQTSTKERNLVHLGMYFIAPMIILLLLMMCRSRRGQGRNFGSQVVTDKGGLRCLD